MKRKKRSYKKWMHRIAIKDCTIHIQSAEYRHAKAEFRAGTATFSECMKYLRNTHVLPNIRNLCIDYELPQRHREKCRTQCLLERLI